MMGKKSKNNSIIKTTSTSLVKAENAIQITNKLVSSRVESLFNEAFYILNSRDVSFGEDNFFQLITKNPKKSQEFLCVANTKNDYSKAANSFSKIINMRPSFEIAYCYRGVCKWRLGKYENAIMDFNIATDLKPDYSDAYFYRGRTRSAIQKIEPGLHHYQNFGLKRDKILDLKNIETSKKIFFDLINDYNKAIKIDPNYCMAYYDRAEVYEFYEKYVDAIEDYRKVIDLESNSFLAETACRRCGELNLHLNNYEEAVRNFSRAIQSCDSSLIMDEDLYYSRANAFMKLRKYEAAIEDYTKIINKQGLLISNAYLGRAEAKKRIGDYEGAKQDLESAQMHSL